MKTTIQRFIVLLCLFGVAHGSQDWPGTWSALNFTVQRGTKEAKVSLVGIDKLKSAKFSFGKTNYSVPVSELVGVKLPQLHTTRLLFGSYSYGDEKPDPYYIIEMRYGDSLGKGVYPIVQFLFNKGKYVKRIVMIQESETTLQDYVKFPGQKEEKAGATERVYPPKKK